MSEPAAIGQDNVVPINGRMSEQEYKAERAKLASTYGDVSKYAGAKREQALAIFYYRSGWTQEEIAKREGIAHQRISETLQFGRFLNFAGNPASTKRADPEFAGNPANLPNNLTRSGFQFYWKRTDNLSGNERGRFQRIAELIQDDLSLRKPRGPRGLGKKIIEAFGDGKWYSLAEIIERTEATTEEVVSVLDSIRKNGAYKCKCERKQIPNSFAYRFFKETRMISSTELTTKLAPIIKDLVVEGRKNMATVSPPTVARLAALLKRHLDDWTE